MANYKAQWRVTMTDANGESATISWQEIVADTETIASLMLGISGFITALGAPGTITNAKVTSATVTLLNEKASPDGAVDAEYSSVTDGARISLINSVGGKGSFTIPAPVPGVFGATPNEDTVLETGAAAALIAYMKTVAVLNGALLNVYNGGVKVGRHARRRAQHKVG